MPCGAANRQIISIDQLKRPAKRKRQVQVHDFHCADCGLTLKNRLPDYRHRCSGQVQMPDNLEYLEQRRTACDGCEYNDGNDVCQWYKAKRPEANARISIGQKMPWAKCPKWTRHMIFCPECGSKLFDKDKEPDDCRYCGWKANALSINAKSHPPGSMDSHCYAVTALSLMEHHQRRQSACLDSWRAFGLTIASVNTPAEIARLSTVYPQVSMWIPSHDVTEGEKPTQKIKTIANVAITLNHTLLLINSDIAIHGDQGLITRPLDQGKQVVGIRWNFKNDMRFADQEQWGIDAFSITPEYAKSLPDSPLGIGKAMWDYWLPVHSESIEQPMHWIGEPLLFHQSHPVFWSQETLRNGAAWVEEHYGVDLVDDNARAAWRRSFPFSDKCEGITATTPPAPV